jgi:dTDP-4-amino-4,6-dideoxygalactose transaminase
MTGSDRAVSEDPSVIPVFQPVIGDDTLKAVSDAFEVGWLGMGAATAAFEKGIAERIGAGDRQVVATNTGTSALHIAVALAGVGPGDEVIVPSFNFVADHQAISAEGASPMFCDIREDNLGIDPDQAEALISERTKAIMPLHFAGVPCDLDRVYKLAEANGLRVIEDATHAFGSLYGGKTIGGFGDLTCFSFDPVKIITSIDGGAVVMPPGGEVGRAKHLRLLGIDKDTELRYQNKRAWDYDVVSKGFRYHLTNINASIGLSQLARVDEFISGRQSSCRLYNELLSGVPTIRIPETDFEGISPFIYTIRVLDGRREALIEHLRANGIATGIHFMPAHTYSYYRACRRGDMTVTERISSQILTLPLHSGMQGETVERICSEIRSFFA